jgi:hypothetical protein
VKHGLNRRHMSSINNTLPLDYFTSIASTCIWIFFNLNLTTRVLGRKLLLACQTLGSLARLGHAAGHTRLLGRERWSTKIPKRSVRRTRTRATGFRKRMLCHSDTSVFVVRGLTQTFSHVRKRSTRWQCEIGRVLLESWFAFLLLICN